MATRSAIGMRTYDGNIKAVYCHWDGYLEGVGKTLLESYKDVFKVNQLLDEGNISNLKSTIKATAFYADEEDIENNIPVIFNTVQEMIEYFSNSEYFYVFEDDYWTVSTGGNFAKLADVMKELENV